MAGQADVIDSSRLPADVDWTDTCAAPFIPDFCTWDRSLFPRLVVETHDGGETRSFAAFFLPMSTLSRGGVTALDLR